MIVVLFEMLPTARHLTIPTPPPVRHYGQQNDAHGASGTRQRGPSTLQVGIGQREAQDPGRIYSNYRRSQESTISVLNAQPAGWASPDSANASRFMMRRPCGRSARGRLVKDVGGAPVRKRRCSVAMRRARQTGESIVELRRKKREARGCDPRNQYNGIEHRGPPVDRFPRELIAV